MNAALGFTTALMLACGGWMALGLGMDRHYADAYGRGAVPIDRTRALLRLSGALALMMVFALSVMLQGWTIGTVLCLGTLTLGAWAVVLLLAYAPHRALACGKVFAVSALLLGLGWLFG